MGQYFRACYASRRAIHYFPTVKNVRQCVQLKERWREKGGTGGEGESNPLSDFNEGAGYFFFTGKILPEQVDPASFSLLFPVVIQ